MMGVLEWPGRFLKRLRRMERQGRSEESGRGKFRKGRFSIVYEYLTRIGLKKKRDE